MDLLRPGGSLAGEEKVRPHTHLIKCLMSQLHACDPAVCRVFQVFCPGALRGAGLCHLRKGSCVFAQQHLAAGCLSLAVLVNEGPEGLQRVCSCKQSLARGAWCCGGGRWDASRVRVCSSGCAALLCSAVHQPTRPSCFAPGMLAAIDPETQHKFSTAPCLHQSVHRHPLLQQTWCGLPGSMPGSLPALCPFTQLLGFCACRGSGLGWDEVACRELPPRQTSPVSCSPTSTTDRDTARSCPLHSLSSSCREPRKRAAWP